MKRCPFCDKIDISGLYLHYKSLFWVMRFNEQLPNLSFKKWLLDSKENHFLLLLSHSIIVFEFIWFKLYFYYPNIFPDSIDYIAGAIENRSISFRPIGYIKFLQAVHFISSSHIALISVQYILLQLSITYLLFSISYLFSLSKWIFRILLIGCIINPLVYHLSNMVSSDPLFTALSLLWLAQILWLLARPGIALLISHAIVLLLAFTVRYNALYYPLISVTIILFSQVSVKAKLLGIAFAFALLGSFIVFTRLQFKKLTGIAQFAPFNGWMTVVNALAVYCHADYLDKPQSMPSKFQQLHQQVNEYIDSLHHTKHGKIHREAPYFMWQKQSPLYRYLNGKLPLNYYFHPDFKQWASVASFYEEYGLLIIKKHPILYFKYHIMQNLSIYNNSWLEFIGEYKVSYKRIGPEARLWFQIKPFNSIIVRHPLDIIKHVATAHKITTGLIVFLCPILIVLMKLNKSKTRFSKALPWLFLIWIFNLAFTILACLPTFRYLVFQFFLTFILDVLILDELFRFLISIKMQRILTKTIPRA